MGYDPWAWLVWGREVAALDLDTTAGPAWKPLPVVVTTALAPLGPAAPWLWLLLARAAGVLAVLGAAVLAARLAGREVAAVAGVAAALALLAVSGFARGVALGFSEGALLACLLVAATCHLDGRHGRGLLLTCAAALLRPEALPLAAASGVRWAREGRRGVRAGVLAAGGLAVVSLWLLPDLWGAGDLLRSGARARVAEPGAPSLAARPALATIEAFGAMVAPAALALALVPLALGARRGLAGALAVGALGWLLVVAAMSEVGFSGEQRYLLPAAAVVAVLAGAGAGRLALLAGRRLGRAPAAIASALVLASAAALLAPAARGEAAAHAHDARLGRDLGAAVARAGGAERLGACAPLVAGRYRFPIVAWHLGVPMSALSLAPRAAGAVLSSPLHAGQPPTPAGPRAMPLRAAAGLWRVYARCGPGR